MRKPVSCQLYSRLSKFMSAPIPLAPIGTRMQCTSSENLPPGESRSRRRVDLDYDYLCDPANTESIARLIRHRKNRGDIRRVVELGRRLQTGGLGNEERLSLEQELEREALRIPNRASPHLWQYGDDPKVWELTHPSFETRRSFVCLIVCLMAQFGGIIINLSVHQWPLTIP